MSLIDILIIGWSVNIGASLFMMIFGLISVSLFVIVGKPVDMLNLTTVTNRHSRVMSQIPEKEKKKLKNESIIKFFIPFSGILKLLLFLKEFHSVNYNTLMLLEKESDEYIEKYNLKDVR